MNWNSRNKDMLKFYIKLFVFQTIMFSLMYYIFKLDNGSNKIDMRPLAIFGYILSITITFIIPMFKLFFKKQ